MTIKSSFPKGVRRCMIDIPLETSSKIIFVFVGKKSNTCLNTRVSF